MGRSQFTYDIIIELWPLGRVLNWLGDRPVLGPLLRPRSAAKENEAVIIPVQEAVQGTESVVLPYPLLSPLLEKASTRVILNECPCRRGENCQDYPHDLGCLFLGDGAAEIAQDVGRPIVLGDGAAEINPAMGPDG